MSERQRNWCKSRGGDCNMELRNGVRPCYPCPVAKGKVESELKRITMVELTSTGMDELAGEISGKIRVQVQDGVMTIYDESGQIMDRRY